MSHNDYIGTYAAYDTEDMIEMMDHYASVYHGPVEYILQLYVEGVCISTEGWFNGESWITPFNHTVEKKPLMNDNLGPSCGCAGNAVWAWFYGYNHIIEEGIKRMGPILREFRYRGPIDLNTAVNEEGLWALEFTPRFGYDALPALLKLYQGDFAELLGALARGEQVREMSLRRGFGTAVRVSVPPYPSEEFRHAGGIPVRGWTKGDRDNLYFYEVQLDQNDHFVTSPAYGAVASLLGYGQDIEEAFQEPYCLARKARIPDKQYRTDLAQVLSTDYARFCRLLDLQRRTGHPVDETVGVVGASGP
jgi:phosphoribosylamine--glycine ligase